MNRVLWLFAIAFLLYSCSGGAEEPQFRQSKERQIIQVSPERPVRIELKKTTKGYTWTLRGEDIEKVIEADRRLRSYIGDKEQRH